MMNSQLKIQVSILLMMICITTSAQFNKKYKSHYSNGQLQSKGRIDKNDNKIGTWESYHKNGTLWKKEKYNKQGKLNGTVKKYYENGHLQQFGYYHNGNKCGEWCAFSDSLKLVELVHADTAMRGSKWEWMLLSRAYKCKIKGSNWHFYDSEGLLIAKGKFKNGLRTGLWSYFYPDGHIFKKGKYVANKKSGKWQRYHSNGALESTGKYSKGLMQGKWVNYKNDGSFKSSYQYLNDRREGEGVFASEEDRNKESASKLTEMYFTNREGDKITEYDFEQHVGLVIGSTGMQGKFITMEMNDEEEVSYQVNNLCIYNMIVEDYPINNNKEVIQLIVKDAEELVY